ncbi:MAG TPA: LEA type 2 family protein [Candidatus Thermoplasmatota archaeon]|nr:LEA type 2 family protein [Candidatus Thermoplasmatota archaeon]
MKKIIVIILVAATILNIVAGAFLFLDIQQMDIPETTLALEIITITTDEAVLQTTLSINNHNSFPVILQNITMITTDENGETINHLTMPGGETKAHENRSFTTTANIRFDGSLPTHLTSRLTGTFGTIFFGIIKKTFPLKFTIETSLNNILEQFTLPHIHLAANFSDITQEGINFTGVIEITNPNTIDISVENLSADITTETGIPVGTVTIQGETIPAKTTKQLTGSGWILLKALNAVSLRMTLTGDIIISIAGIRKPMNISLEADIIPPYLGQLLSDLPTEASLTGVYTYTLKDGLHDEVTFTIKNPNKLTLLANDITVQIYRVDGTKTRMISNGTLPDGFIAPQSTTVLQGDMFIPLTQLWPRRGERFIPDQLQVILRSNVTIQGFNQTIWIGVIGYQDFPFHRFS